MALRNIPPNISRIMSLLMLLIFDILRSIQAAYDAVSKRKEAENMLKSSVAVFPLLLTEEGYFSWGVVIAFQLKEVEVRKFFAGVGLLRCT